MLPRGFLLRGFAASLERTERWLGVLSELWNAKSRHGHDVHEVQLQLEGRGRSEVQGHDVDVVTASSGRCSCRSSGRACARTWRAAACCCSDAAASRGSAAEQVEGNDGRCRAADAGLCENAASARAGRSDDDASGRRSAACRSARRGLRWWWQRQRARGDDGRDRSELPAAARLRCTSARRRWSAAEPDVRRASSSESDGPASGWWLWWSASGWWLRWSASWWS